MILLRHGQTMFNVVYGATRRDPGIRDPDLTGEGRAQAQAAAEALRAEGVKRLITSPYTRALQTTEIIAAALDIPVTVEPLVRERAAFVCDIGTTRSQLAAAWRDYGFGHVDEVWWHEAEEHEAVLAARCERFRLIMADLPDWRTVAVITHWGFIRALTGQRIHNGEMIRCDPMQGPKSCSDTAC